MSRGVSPMEKIGDFPASHVSHEKNLLLYIMMVV